MKIENMLQRFSCNSFLFKSPCNNLIQTFLDNRNQRVALNGKSSQYSLVEADVAQGSILGTLLFLVYINDLPKGLRSNAKLFTYNSSLFSTVTSPMRL